MHVKPLAWIIRSSTAKCFSDILVNSSDEQKMVSQKINFELCD